MTMEKTDGLVIRQVDWSESSRIVTFFTRDWGKISVVAKGARRLKGPFDAALDLLTRCRIVFIRKSSNSLDILTEAQLTSRFRPKKHGLPAFYGGCYVAELLAGLTEEYDPHPQLYDESAQTLDRLESDFPPSITLLRFELIVLREIGQLPSFDECLTCREPIGDNGPFAFWLSQGGLLCRNCCKDFDRTTLIHSGTVAVIHRLVGEPTNLSDRLLISTQQEQEIRGITTSAITQALGRRPKMLRYLSH